MSKPNLVNVHMDNIGKVLLVYHVQVNNKSIILLPKNANVQITTNGYHILTTAYIYNLVQVAQIKSTIQSLKNANVNQTTSISEITSYLIALNNVHLDKQDPSNHLINANVNLDTSGQVTPAHKIKNVHMVNHGTVINVYQVTLVNLVTSGTPSSKNAQSTINIHAPITTSSHIPN